MNSSPTYVSVPEAGWAVSSYRDFRSAALNRTPIIYTGANDGMLHAFRASDGREMLGYVPGIFYNNDPAKSSLSRLTNQAYSHKYFVDGTPMVNDVEVGSAWKTVLVGGLNWGGGHTMLSMLPTRMVSPLRPWVVYGWPCAGFFTDKCCQLGYVGIHERQRRRSWVFIHPADLSVVQGGCQQIIKMRNGRGQLSWVMVTTVTPARQHCSYSSLTVPRPQVCTATPGPRDRLYQAGCRYAGAKQ